MPVAASSQQPSAEVLEDLCTRFLFNVPAEDLASWERMLFLVEQAHWFYEDFVREKDLMLRSYALKDFLALILRVVPGLESYVSQAPQLLEHFNAYKQTIPTMGAIILDPTMEKCLLVRGWKAGSGWGFPKGKISKGEADSACAVREVLEETGYDIGPHLVEADFIEMHIREQRSRLYIIQGVDESTPFAPIARGEIGGLAWHNVLDLPATKESATLAYTTQAGVRHKFYLVWPYMKQLQHWIKAKRRVAAACAAAAVPSAPQAESAANAPGKSKRQQRKANKGVVDRQQAAVEAATEVQQALPDARPAPLSKTLQPAGVPGQCWLDFKFDRQAIMHAMLQAVGRRRT